MATKKSASQSSSKAKKRSAAPSSRKTLRASSAPLALKNDSNDKSKKDSKEDAEVKAEPVAEGPAKDVAKAPDKAQAKLPDEDKAAATPAASDDAPKQNESGARPAVGEDGPRKDDTHSQPAARSEESVAKPDEPAPARAPAPAAPAGEEAALAVLLPPDAIEAWDPNSPAPPPGKTPPGDSRSLRRIRDGAEEFVLIYRSGSHLITRAGKVGTMGTWTVVEYPHIGSAANAYAHKCSALTYDGYRDL